MKIKSIRIKIVFLSGLLLLILGAILISYSSYKEYSAALDSAQNQVMTSTEVEAYKINRLLTEYLSAANTLAQSFAVANSSEDISLERNETDEMLRNIVRHHPDYYGLYSIWEPQAFDGRDDEFINAPGHGNTGRYNTYFYWEDDKVLREQEPDSAEVFEQEDYYRIVKTRRQEAILEPYVYDSVLMTSIVSPVMSNGLFKGMVGVDISLQSLQQQIEETAAGLFDGAAQIALVSESGSLVSFSGDAGKVGKMSSDVIGNWIKVRLADGVEWSAYEEGQLQTVIPLEIGKTGSTWFFAVTIPSAVITAEAVADLYRQIAFGILLTVGALVALWFFSGTLSRPISKAAEFATVVSKGDFSKRINLISHDEIGRLGGALDQMAENLEKSAHLAESIAQGDLSRDVTVASEQDMLGRAVQTMTINLNEIIGQVQSASDQIAAGSNEVSDSSQTLSQGATEQASSIEEISASLNEMSAQTTTNAENANQANILTHEAQQAAQKGNDQMGAMVEAMNDINDSAQNISKIIKTIDEIAFQTNLLALNAAVEAARAGQHGKGFAVVAEEVRNLAARSAKAAAETAELIEGSVEKTRNGSDIARNTAEALEGIVGGVSKVADLVGEIATASTEQAQGITQINQAVVQIDVVTQQNTASAEESAAAAEELSSQAAHLKQLLSRFTLAAQAEQSAALPFADHQASSPSAPDMKQIPAERGWEKVAAGGSVKPEICLEDTEFGRY